jgi:hypothetical protein
VFSWLADTGLSLHQAVPQSAPATEPSEKRTSERITPSTINTFCTACGVETVPRSVAGSNSWEDPTRSESDSCTHSFPLSRLPLLDVDSIAATHSQNRPNDPVQSTPDEKWLFPWSNREILATTDPTLTIAVHYIVAPLQLRCFPELNDASILGAGLLRPSPTNSTAITPIVDDSDLLIFRSDLNITSESVSTSLASTAVLGFAVREFARRLVNSAVTAFARDRTRGSTRAVLTPAHVSVGVLGSFLTRDGVLRELPSLPIALVLATPATRCDRSPPSDIIDISSHRGSIPGVRSSSHCAFDDGVGPS